MMSSLSETRMDAFTFIFPQSNRELQNLLSYLESTLQFQLQIFSLSCSRLFQSWASQAVFNEGFSASSGRGLGCEKTLAARSLFLFASSLLLFYTLWPLALVGGDSVVPDEDHGGGVEEKKY